jgi:hypothetical protein
MVSHPRLFANTVVAGPPTLDAYRFARTYTQPTTKAAGTELPSTNPLWEYFQNHKEGPGVWKWEHYFDIYHRHFARFIGQKVNVLEIGIYAGGSLPMWRSYFGDESHVYGVDIEEACKAYESEHVSIFIGDQEDRAFWDRFKKSVDGIDIVIDDGGHTPEQQRVTLEELLPYLRPGGIYLCEDVHGRNNPFAAFARSLVDELNHTTALTPPTLRSITSPFQSAIHSVHFYPYVAVIEKNDVLRTQLTSPKHGTEWPSRVRGRS